MKNKINFLYNNYSFLKEKFINKNFFFYFFYFLLKYFNNKIFIYLFFFKFKLYYLLNFRLNLTYNYKNNLNFSWLKKFYKNIKFNEPYKFIYNSKDAKTLFIDLTYDNKGYSICLNEKDLFLWYIGKKDLIFLNFHFFIKNNILFFLKNNYISYNFFNNYRFDLFNFYLNKFKYNNLRWLNKIYIFKKFKKVSFIIKNKFFREFGRFFWKTKLLYWFEYYKLIKNNLNLFNLFFYFFKLNCLNYFYLFETIIFSKYFLLINYYNIRLKYFGYFYNVFLKYFYDNYFFNFYLFDFYWYLIYFRVFFYRYFRYNSSLKAIDSIYGSFQHVEKLYIYFSNLMLDTTYIDEWLINNNLCGKKINLLFLKGLFLLDENFNIKRRPWHSFYKRFYDILYYIKINKNKFKVFNQLYKILYKIMYFIKHNKYYLRKKSFRLKPWRRGVQVYL